MLRRLLIAAAAVADGFMQALWPAPINRWAELFTGLEDTIEVPEPLVLRFRDCGCQFRLMPDDLPFNDLMCVHGCFVSDVADNVDGNVFVGVSV